MTTKNSLFSLFSLFINDENTKIKYNPRWRINKGALSQLIYHLNIMAQNTKNNKNNNKFQIKMFPIINDICHQIINNYHFLLNKYLLDSDSKNIFPYFICGPLNNGTMFKPTTNKKEMRTYDYCELGITMRTIKDRLFHIKRVANNRINNDKYCNDIDIYNNLILFSSELQNTVEKYSILWKNKVSEFNCD